MTWRDAVARLRRHKKYVTAEPDVITFELDGTPDYLVCPRSGARRAHGRIPWAHPVGPCFSCIGAAAGARVRRPVGRHARLGRVRVHPEAPGRERRHHQGQCQGAGQGGHRAGIEGQRQYDGPDVRGRGAVAGRCRALSVVVAPSEHALELKELFVGRSRPSSLSLCILL